MGQQARISQIELDFSFTGTQVAVSATKPGSIGFTIRATGPLANLSQFLNTIETQAPQFAFTLQEVNLTQQATGNYKLNIQGTIFFKMNVSSTTP